MAAAAVAVAATRSGNQALTAEECCTDLTTAAARAPTRGRPRERRRPASTPTAARRFRASAAQTSPRWTCTGDLVGARCVVANANPSCPWHSHALRRQDAFQAASPSMRAAGAPANGGAAVASGGRDGSRDAGRRQRRRRHAPSPARDASSDASDDDSSAEIVRRCRAVSHPRSPSLTRFPLLPSSPEPPSVAKRGADPVRARQAVLQHQGAALQAAVQAVHAERLPQAHAVDAERAVLRGAARPAAQPGHGRDQGGARVPGAGAELRQERAREARDQPQARRLGAAAAHEQEVQPTRGPAGVHVFAGRPFPAAVADTCQGGCRQPASARAPSPLTQSSLASPQAGAGAGSQGAEGGTRSRTKLAEVDLDKDHRLRPIKQLHDRARREVMLMRRQFQLPDQP